MATDRRVWTGIALIFILSMLSGRVVAKDVDLVSPGKPVYVESSEIEDERKRDSWSGQLGMGLALAPDFLGARNHDFEGAIQFRASWRDKVFIENNKIGSVLHTSPFLKAGVIARWNLGRREDLTLRHATGAEEVGDAVEVGIFAATSLYKLFFSGELYQGVSKVHKGTNVEIETGYTFEMNSRLKVTPIFGAKWASRGFMQAFFGVNAEEGGTFPVYEPSGGLYELYGELSAEHRLGKNWLLKSSFRLAQLRNEAARSPIIRSDIGGRYQATSYIGIAWLF